MSEWIKVTEKEPNDGETYAVYQIPTDEIIQEYEDEIAQTGEVYDARELHHVCLGFYRKDLNGFISPDPDGGFVLLNADYYFRLPEPPNAKIINGN